MRRFCPHQAKVRSTTQRRGKTLKASPWKQLLPVDLSTLFRPLLCPDPSYLLGYWLGCAMDNLNAYAEFLLCPLLAPTLVTSVYPQMRKTWKALTGGFQQQPEPVLVGDLRAVDPNLEHQSLRIHQ